MTKRSHIHAIGILEEERKGTWGKKMAENFPHLMKDINIQLEMLGEPQQVGRWPFQIY